MNKKFIIILVAAGLMVYFNSLFNHFLWDDEEMVSAFLSRTPVDHTYFRPIMSSVYYLIFTLFNGSPFFFRLLQVVIHIANSILIFFLFNFFFGQIKPLSFFLSLIFLIHPINSEAVLFISATQEPLFVFLGLGGLLILVRKKILNETALVIVGGMLALTLLVKETGIVFFVLALFYLWLYQKKMVLKFFIIALMVGWLYWLFRVTAGSTYIQGQGLFPIMRVSLLQRILTIPKIIFYYLKQFFFPWRLAIDQQWVVYQPNFINFFLPLFIDAVFFISLFVFALRTKNKFFIFFLVWFLIGLGTHLQLIPLNMVAAERWFYFPIIGLLGMGGAIISWLWCCINIKTTMKQWVNLILILLIVLLSARTVIRTFDWRNDLTLFSHDIKITQSTKDLENNLGVALFRVSRVDEAKIHFIKSTKLAPDWWGNWNNLGAVYEAEGNLKQADAYYQRSIKNGDYYVAYENHAGILIKEGKIQQAKDFLENEALSKFPKNPILIRYYSFVSKQK